MMWCELTRPDVPSGWFASRWVNKQINYMNKIRFGGGKTQQKQINNQTKHSSIKSNQDQNKILFKWIFEN